MPVSERIGSAGLLAGCSVDLPVHAVLYTNKKNALVFEVCIFGRVHIATFRSPNQTAMLMTMRLSMFLRATRSWLSLVCLFVFALAATRAQSPAITLIPAVVVAGAPELIRVSAPSAAAIDGEWLGRNLEFFRGRDGRAWWRQ